MPYININEYDYTITGPKTYGENIVAIPLNASDGPSDTWVTVNTYDDFVQLFGPNPNPNSTLGNSWEYAANLLLREMPVCVRRITNELTEDGLNTETPLQDVAIARGIIKVKDVIGASNTTNVALNEFEMNVKDPAAHSRLLKSTKGETIANPLYVQFKDELEDGEIQIGEFPNVYALQTDIYNDIDTVPAGEEANVTKPLSFADVLTTNTEWNFVGKHRNPHYRYEIENEATPMSYIQKNNPDGQIGDFFINEAGHIVKYVSVAFPNPNRVGAKLQFPDDLLSLNLENLVDGTSFVDVTYDETNTKTVNLVWLYTPNAKTTVKNHKFVNGNIAVSGKSYKIFETNADLPTTKVAENYFAGVKSTNTIWVYTNDTWENTGATLANLDVVNTSANGQNFGIETEIPFTCTNEAIKTNIYRHYFNWENTGEATYIPTSGDEDYPEIAYVKDLYWENSNNEIGTRPHTTVEGANVQLNDIVINTVSNVSRSGVILQVNNYQDIIIDSDYSDNRLVSGKISIFNPNSTAVNVYGLKITQKADNGEVSLIYNSGIENVTKSTDRITSDPLLRLVDVLGKDLALPLPKLDSTTGLDRWYFEIPAGATLYYNMNLSGSVVNLTVAGFENTDNEDDVQPFDLQIKVLESTVGCYALNLTSKDDEVLEVIKYALPPIVEGEEDIDDLDVVDGHGNFNLFTVNYKYPGTNGNFLKATIKTIAHQGIFVFVYRDNQQVERIELCSFRFRNANTGRIHVLDMDYNKDDIWKIVLLKFGIKLPYDGYTSPVPLEGQYITVNLNKNLLNGVYDLESLDYVYSLFAQTGTQVAKLEGGKNPDDEHVKHECFKCFEPLKDKYRYDITYVTSGTFIDKIITSKMITDESIINASKATEYRLIEDSLVDLANERKDCVAYLDTPYDLPLEQVVDYFAHISTSYAAAYDPWGLVYLPTGTLKWMPPSFIQLFTHAKSLQNGNKSYLPPAGVRRALVPEIIQTNHELSSRFITDWQNQDAPQFINPIIWINGYDYTIYGQKTLYNVINASDKYESALQDLNVRLVANEIKKLIFRTCIELTFELNNMMTWNEFKSKIEPTLVVMLGEGVLTNYDIKMGTETMTKADLNSGHIVGTVSVSIARAATDWDINFELTPNSVTFSEYDYNSTYSE